MNAVTRNVRDLNSADRQAIEHLLGQQLQENQRLLIQVMNVDLSAPEPEQGGTEQAKLPDWCNVYEGLSDEDIDEIEKSIVRTPGGRSFA